MNNFEENKIKVVEVPIEKVKDEKQVIKPVDKEVLDKKNGTYIIISMLVGILILFGAAYLGKGIMNKQNNEKIELSDKQIEGKILLNGNTCYNQKDYFVITKAEVNDPGENILVKYKKDSGKEYNCEYKVEEGDFELKNIRIENNLSINHAQYFSYIQDDKLIVDSGTGTKRELLIYDLKTKEKVFKDDYNLHQVGLDLKENVLTYWRTTKDVPNLENCSKVEEYKKMGGAQIETKVSLNLIDLTKTEFKEFRCLQAE